MQFDKNAAAAIAASLNSPSGVRTNESRPVTEEDIINLEANLEEAGDIMLQSTIPTADDLPNDGAPIIIDGANKEELRIILNDDLTGLQSHTFRIGMDDASR